jgi:hypothetical protein
MKDVTFLSVTSRKGLSSYSRMLVLPGVLVVAHVCAENSSTFDVPGNTGETWGTIEQLNEVPCTEVFVVKNKMGPTPANISQSGLDRQL